LSEKAEKNGCDQDATHEAPEHAVDLQTSLTGSNEAVQS
jgi:hypothetical protein